MINALIVRRNTQFAKDEKALRAAQYVRMSTELQRYPPGPLGAAAIVRMRSGAPPCGKATRIRERIPVIASADAGRTHSRGHVNVQRCHAQHGGAMPLRTRLLLTVILLVFLGAHACVAFIVLPSAHSDWQNSRPTQMGTQD